RIVRRNSHGICNNLRPLFSPIRPAGRRSVSGVSQPSILERVAVWNRKTMDTGNVRWLVDGRRTAGTVHVTQHGAELCTWPPLGSEAGSDDLSDSRLDRGVPLCGDLAENFGATLLGSGLVYRQRLLYLQIRLW